MCRARRLAEHLETLCAEIEQEASRAGQAVSAADLQISAIYHEIERTRFSAAQGYALARRLQAALALRRAAKLEDQTLRMLRDRTCGLKGVTARVAQRVDNHRRWSGRDPFGELAQAEAAAAAEGPGGEWPGEGPGRDGLE